MCLVVPLKVIKQQGGQWLMEDKRRVKSLVGQVKIGDYLICQQDLGIEKISKNKAKLIRDALRQGL
ncbi:MAG: HypC/HybG/HupF family hydrogenase formation chaperone [Patescibacteria group bacterium]|nr:HypC/HybG/HupF family hydrogenase formation chaperone [Patescibacteria group bacterium]MDP4030901.1 HypC/HybG/HupF family hydrogenase formation chaperone [Candidatus Beckwithbacteria bacterium]MDZ4229429.1 HypC/HybG/HupF family hydrogenase formation chaperone [Patescibacteria group bacterium]